MYPDEELKMIGPASPHERAYLPLYKIKKICFAVRTYSDSELTALFDATLALVKDLKEHEYTRSPSIHFHAMGAKIISCAWRTEPFSETYKIANTSEGGSYESAKSSTPLLTIGAEVRRETAILSP
jgi:hypothetical protein